MSESRRNKRKNEGIKHHPKSDIIKKRQNHCCGCDSINFYSSGITSCLLLSIQIRIDIILIQIYE